MVKSLKYITYDALGVSARTYRTGCNVSLALLVRYMYLTLLHAVICPGGFIRSGLILMKIEGHLDAKESFLKVLILIFFTKNEIS